MGIDHDAADNKDESELAKTLVIEPLDDGATLEIEREGEPPRKKRRFGWLIAIVVVAALLVVGFFVGDQIARQYATDLVRDRIIEALKIDKNTEVAVGLGSGSILLQAIGGSINDVTIDIPELELGEISAGASVTAAGVPLDMSKPVQKLGITVTVTEEQAQKLKTFLSGIDLTSIELGNGVISVGTNFDVFGLLKVPVSVDLAPSATAGGIAFDPQTIVLDGNPISVQDLRDNPLVSALAGQLLASQTFCVAEYLPQALALTDVDVVGETLVLTINGDGTALGGPEIATMGVCS
ncbi:MAG: DUF2993 domain-containing protein [Rhodoglobus sp.]